MRDNIYDGSKGRSISTLVTLTVLFLMWGFITVLNYVLINHLAFIFQVDYALSTLMNLTFFFAYLVVSLQAGGMIKNVGYKKTMITGWLMASAGCFLFYYAVYQREYKYFLFALFILAAGITILQVSVNLYVVLYGRWKTAASRLTLSQAFNSLGTFLAPLLAQYILWSYVDLPVESLQYFSKDDIVQVEAPYVHYPYLFLGVLMLCYTLYLFLTDIPHIETRFLEPENEITSLRKRHVMHFPQLRLGAFAIFVYVGAEVALANYIHDFAGDNEQYYWGAAMIGRFIGAFLLYKVSLRHAVAFCAGMAFLLVSVSMVTQGEVSIWAVTAVGLFNSILFPCIFTLGVNGLGKFSINGSAVLIMFIVGGAVVPFNVRNYSYVSYKVAFVIVLMCYLYILVYALVLSKFKRKQELTSS